jgi:hypothetical protein
MGPRFSRQPTAKPADQEAITRLSPEPRTQDQTRASIKPASGRATRFPSVATLRAA